MNVRLMTIVLIYNREIVRVKCEAIENLLRKLEGCERTKGKSSRRRNKV
jgi:hypothetical protein